MSFGIEIWRFVFMCIVCLLHFETAYSGGTNRIFACGYLGVEFFFILSGFMMMNHAERSNDTAVKYVYERIKRFAPSLVISYCILIVNSILQFNWGPVRAIQEIYNHIWEYLFLNCTGVHWEIWNGVTWYISALLIVSYFLYWLIKRDEKIFIEFLGPLLIFLIYSWYAYQGNGLDYHLQWERISTSAISRAVGGMSIGCILFHTNKKLISQKVKICVGGGTCIEIIAIIMILINIIFAEKNSFNLLVLFLFPVLIIFEYNGWNIWRKYCAKRFIKVLGKVSIDMYLNQVFFIGFFMRIHSKSNFFIDCSLYLIGLFCLAFFLLLLRTNILKYVINYIHLININK